MEEAVVHLFEHNDGHSREPGAALNGVLAVDALPHQRTIVARVVITDPPAELLGQSVEFWGRCVPVGVRSPLGEVAELRERVAFRDLAEETYDFLVPLVVDVSEAGDHEVVIYVRRMVIGRTPLVITLDD